MLIQRLSFRPTLRRVELVKLTRQLFRDDVEIGKSFDLRLDRNSPPLLETREQRKRAAPNKSCAQLRSPSKQGVIARVWACPLSPRCAQKSDCLQSAHLLSLYEAGQATSGCQLLMRAAVRCIAWERQQSCLIDSCMPATLLPVRQWLSSRSSDGWGSVLSVPS